MPFVPVTQSSSSISLTTCNVPQSQFQQVQLQRNCALIIAKESKNFMPQFLANNVGPCNPALSFNKCQVKINDFCTG